MSDFLFFFFFLEGYSVSDLSVFRIILASMHFAIG